MSEYKDRKKGLVSIVMSTYDYSKYICEALDGLKNQTYPYLEIIIVDDCSEDNTEEIVKQWQDKNKHRFANFIYLKLPRNCGSSWALNIGFQLAKGEYIVIHDSDDISHPEKIRKQVEHLIKNPNIAAVGTKFQTFLDKIDHILWPAAWLSYDVKEIEKNYRKTPERHCVSFGTLLLRANIIDTIIGSKKIPDAANDIIFIKDIVRQNYLVDNINEVLISIRIHSERHKSDYEEKRKQRMERRAKIKNMVSVVIPIDDNSTKILTALKSIFAQNYSNIEVIIVDDSYEDKIGPKINKWYTWYKKFHRMTNIQDIIYFKLPTPVGYPWAYNIGAYLSRGEYVVFHGHNGISVRNKISRQVKFLRDNPKFSIVGTNFDGKIHDIKYGNKIKPSYIIHGTSCVNINTIMMKSYVIDETMGLSKKNKGQEDFEFMYRLLYDGYKIENLKTVLYYEYE